MTSPSRAHGARIGREGRGQPKALVEPIAPGEQVVAPMRSSTCLFIRDTYSRDVAVEMEGAGFLRAAYANQHVKALVVRAISDKLDDTDQADQSGWQPAGAAPAAAFAFQLLADLP